MSLHLLTSDLLYGDVVLDALLARSMFVTVGLSQSLLIERTGPNLLKRDIAALVIGLALGVAVAFLTFG